MLTLKITQTRGFQSQDHLRVFLESQLAKITVTTLLKDKIVSVVRLGLKTDYEVTNAPS